VSNTMLYKVCWFGEWFRHAKESEGGFSEPKGLVASPVSVIRSTTDPDAVNSLRPSCRRFSRLILVQAISLSCLKPAPCYVASAAKARQAIGDVACCACSLLIHGPVSMTRHRLRGGHLMAVATCWLI
jgi:hypothetical protein